MVMFGARDWRFTAKTRSVVWSLLGLTAAASMTGRVVEQGPLTPSVMVMPTPGKPLDVFSSEDQYCRGWAVQQSGGASEKAKTDSVVGSAGTGLVLGAAAGALIGGHQGAGVGAGIGGLMGGLAGADTVGYGDAQAQRRYDTAYIQCMYTKGNAVPNMAAGWGQSRMGTTYVMPPPPPTSASSSTAVPPPPPSSAAPNPVQPPAQ